MIELGRDPLAKLRLKTAPRDPLPDQGQGQAPTEGGEAQFEELWRCQVLMPGRAFPTDKFGVVMQYLMAN
eukprot:289930-Alexandrium_andersonii.AAC.1